MDNQADTIVPGPVALAALVTLQGPRDPRWTLQHSDERVAPSSRILH